MQRVVTGFYFLNIYLNFVSREITRSYILSHIACGKGLRSKFNARKELCLLFKEKVLSHRPIVHEVSSNIYFLY